MGELDLGNPQTLVDFTDWARNNYPADHYYLAIDDHGSGTYGISWDDASGNNLDPAEMYWALKEITNSGSWKIDLLAYEACLLGLYENAYEMRDYASYLFFFESISWGSSQTYPAYFNGLTSGMTPLQLGQRIVEQYSLLLSNAPHASGLIDLSRMSALQASVDAFANALIAQVSSNKTMLTEARSATRSYDDNPYLDLWDLADQLSARIPAVVGQATALRNSLDAAIVDNRIIGTAYTRSHGMSIYWPQAALGSYDDYVNHRLYTSTVNGTWDEFLVAYTGGARGMSTDPGGVPRGTVTQIYLPMVLR